MNITTFNLKEFPNPEKLKIALKKLATLDIILCKTDWLRYHSYTPNWTSGVDQAMMDNGSGDNVYLFFSEKGCVVKGFDHESPVSPYANDDEVMWKGIYDGIPAHFEELISDESVMKDDVTFCIWFENETGVWKNGPVEFSNNENDGSDFLLGTIPFTAEAFKDWADSYYEKDLSIDAIQKLFSGDNLSEQLILAIDPEADLKRIKEELTPLGIIF